MKAVRIHSYGGIETLSYEEAPMPRVGAGEVLVRVVAAAVNPVDWKVREGMRKERFSHVFPLILGWDASGLVHEVGPGVTRFRPGDAVFTRPDIGRDGTYAEFVAVRENELALKPATISHVEAASLPLAGITAWTVLFKTAGLKAGQRVLIHAASGGVGTLAVQLAKWRGAHVTATTSAANEALVRSLGADEVIDYRARRFEEACSGMDVVFDTLGKEVQEASWRTLKPGGILVSVFTPPPEEKARAHGVRSAYVFIGPDPEVLESLAGLVDEGRVRPVIGAEFALADIARAHALSQSGRAVGKIALYVGKP